MGDFKISVSGNSGNSSNPLITLVSGSRPKKKKRGRNIENNPHQQKNKTKTPKQTNKKRKYRCTKSKTEWNKSGISMGQSHREWEESHTLYNGEMCCHFTESQVAVNQMCDLQTPLMCGQSLVSPGVCLDQVFPGSWHLAWRIKEVRINSKPARGFIQKQC